MRSCPQQQEAVREDIQNLGFSLTLDTITGISPVLIRRQDAKDQLPWISLANSRVRRLAETSLHPVVFCPAHSGEKSPLPRLSAFARKGAIADVANGKAGADALIGPNSLMMRFTIPRAAPPLKRLVSAVTRAASLFSAMR